MTPLNEIELVQVAFQSLQTTTSYFYKINRSSGVLIQQTLRSGPRAATRLINPANGEERCVTSDDPNNGCEGD